MEPLQLKPIQVFFSYAHQDEEYALGLINHLRGLELRGYISTFRMRDISAGEEWRKTINTRLSSASIIMLLISADFMASDYCIEELERALRLHEAGRAYVIPIITRAYHWQDTPIGAFQVLPVNGKPIQAWGNRDEAYFNIAEGVREVVNVMRNEMVNQLSYLPDLPPLRKLSSEGSVNFNPSERQIQIDLPISTKTDRSANTDIKLDSTESRIREAKNRLTMLRRLSRDDYLQECARWSKKAEEARKNEDWEEESICWEILRDYKPYITQSRERRKIVKENQAHKYIYDEAKQHAENRDKAATKEKLLELWQKAPFYGDPAGLAWQAGLYIPLAGWRRTIWMSVFWSGAVSFLGFIIALILAGTTISGSQYFAALAEILLLPIFIFIVVFSYISYRWIYLRFSFIINTTTSNTTKSGINSSKTNPPLNRQKKQ